MKKRALSFLLSLAMILSLTVPVFAEETSANTQTCITVPSDAELFVGVKDKHFVKFTEVAPVSSAEDGENKTYCFDLQKQQYNYRISGENYVTYGGLFTKKADELNITVTKDQLMPEGKTKTTIDRDSKSNNGRNVADIYLNINPQGYLRLNNGDTFQIVSLRNWEAVNSDTANYFIEPDYHFEVIDINGEPSDIAEIDKNGVLTAKNAGVAVVLVTYDAMTLNFEKGDDFYGAIYPENTGVFVVSVDAEESGIKTGMTINAGKNTEQGKLSGDMLDAEHDCIYYTGDEGEYVFTPVTEDVKVYTAKPVVTANVTYSGFAEVEKSEDGSFSVPLATGRNIVKIEKDGKAEYQIITAKKVNITVNNGEIVHAGDYLNVVCDTLYHPANKLAGVYNMSASVEYAKVSGFDGKLIGSPSVSYNFASSADAQMISSVLTEKNVWGSVTRTKDSAILIPEDYEDDTLTMTGGTIFVSGWGDPYGNHRSITYENGKGANLNADAKLAYFGKLPDIVIPINKSPISSLSLDAENVKKEYYSGEKFDTAAMALVAEYEDETTQTVQNYTVTPEVLADDTEKVVITYRGLTKEIPITVKPSVTSIEITKAPTKTEYTEGDVFDPSGMEVTAHYSNGTEIKTTDYTYTPNRELKTSDKKIKITYNGADAAKGIKAAEQAITVSAQQNSGGNSGTSKINVYFTLLGDSKHGEPAGSNDTHTYKAGNLDTWIAKTKITLNSGSYVIDAVKKALGLKGITFTAGDNYITGIKGLSEKDNGDMSGWMYLLNGTYASQGVDKQAIADGDEIIFHYTDDYTLEDTGYSSGGSSSRPKKDKTDKTETKEEVTETPEETEPEEKEPDKKPVFAADTYADVKESDWHYKAVKFAYENGIMQGTGNGFEPNIDITRAMAVMILWKMQNSPATDFALCFNDVDADAWYTEAIRWAASENIIAGKNDELFGTNDVITREQLAVILYRYAQHIGIETDADDADLSAFDDFDSVSDYAVEAVKWAVSLGIISGRSENLLCPQGSATRAETAAMIMRFCERMVK